MSGFRKRDLAGNGAGPAQGKDTCSDCGGDERRFEVQMEGRTIRLDVLGTGLFSLEVSTRVQSKGGLSEFWSGFGESGILGEVGWFVLR